MPAKDDTRMSANNDENKPARILVVDDEQPITELLSEMLMMMGHEPHCCNFPKEALDRMESEQFDLVLSDFRMPGMNGRQFYKAVQERCPQFMGRIVFLTGDVGNDDTQKFLDSVGNQNLSKPFHFDEVIGLVSRMVNRPEAVAA